MLAVSALLAGFCRTGLIQGLPANANANLGLGFMFTNADMIEGVTHR